MKGDISDKELIGEYLCTITNEKGIPFRVHASEIEDTVYLCFQRAGVTICRHTMYVNDLVLPARLAIMGRYDCDMRTAEKPKRETKPRVPRPTKPVKPKKRADLSTFDIDDFG